MSPFRRPFLKWAGGKFRSLNHICPELPPGKRLVEPFVGAGAVFLNTDYPQYLLNDKNTFLITLYHELRTHGDCFIQDAKSFFSPENNCPTAYYDYRANFNESNDSYEQSLLFLYLNRHCYNGLCRFNRAGQFNVPFGTYRLPYFPERELRLFIERSGLAGFTAEDYTDVLQCTNDGDVVYCDPPYVPLSKTANFTDYVAGGFTLTDQERLAGLAADASRRGALVIITNHDTPFTRRIYRDAELTGFSARRNISRDSANRVNAHELLAIFRPTAAA